MDIGRLVQRTVTGLHARIYRLSGGRVLGSFGGARSVLLTTIGRRTGRTRTTPLMGIRDGERVLLVASNGGAPTHPAWYLNLTDRPEVTIQDGSRRSRYVARTASGEERERLWPKVVAAYSGYDGYQRKTGREIPLVVCEPSPDR